ncbi:hypothetical protein TRVA0_014S01882 [Trichomonascus vanleenenianus]|uniref:Mdm20p n=1 Tax=Trichomonascus vanleenenianus TaxID=2268995 RepID=UPI003EC95A83
MSKELRNLWENINAGNFKQALVKVHKELKKQPDNAYFLAVNGFVLLRQKKTEEALAIARRVAAGAPPNVHVLNVLADVFSETDNLEELGTLMETANRRSPKDAEIIELWNNVMASEGDVRGMLKASMAQLKLNGSRDVTFKTVLCMTLAYEHSSDSEKKLYPMLAGRYLEKLAPYKDPQEVYVQAEVYKMLSVEKAIEYLKSEEVRKWGSLDLDVMLLDLLKKTEKWADLVEQCLARLAVAQQNWIYWSHLVLAASKLGDFTQAGDFITKHKSGSSRNAHLAYVYYVSEHMPDQLLAAITEFFTKFGSKRSTFDDLKPYIKTLGQAEQAQLVSWLTEKQLIELPTNNDLTWQVNIAKIKYYLEPNNIDTVKTAMADYHRSAHLLKGKDTKDYHSGCDFVLIAASYLVDHADIIPQALETAAVLLELACESDLHNFYVRMWLVRIYLALGCYSVAKIHYNALSIKSVQQETLSYHLLTRLSSTRPDARYIEENSDIYVQAEESSEYVKFAFSKRAYTQVEGILELNEKLDSSLYKRVMDIELLRCKRFTKFEPSADAIERVQPKTYSDNRDFDAMWDLADNKLSSRFTLGPVVDDGWVKTMIARERAIRRLISEEGLSEVLADLTEPVSFTEAERWSLRVVVALVKCALTKKDQAGYTSVVELLATRPSISSAASSWEYFHWQYTILEACKVITGYLNRLKGVRHQFKPNMDGLEVLKKAVDDLVVSVKKSAQEQKDCRMDRYKSTVDALVSTNPIPALLSVDKIEDFIDRVEASREENLVFMRAY